MVEKVTEAVDSSCRSTADHESVINSCRILTRMIPYIFEDSDWNNFFWSKPNLSKGSGENAGGQTLAKTLICAISDLLFCPDFTVSSSSKNR